MWVHKDLLADRPVQLVSGASQVQQVQLDSKARQVSLVRLDRLGYQDCWDQLAGQVPLEQRQSSLVPLDLPVDQQVQRAALVRLAQVDQQDQLAALAALAAQVRLDQHQTLVPQVPQGQLVDQPASQVQRVCAA
jgi:hypothetical protein